jgi:hypothetical protein
MQKRREYIFTHHLRERFVQRTQTKYEHLWWPCQTENCETCNNLLKDCMWEVSHNRRTIDTKLARRIEEAEENRSYINNTEFMSWYYEKYGFDKKFEFLAHEDLLFIVVVDNGKKIVVTCVLAKTHIAGKQSLRTKYNGVKKQREQAIKKKIEESLQILE